jgi:glycosyltransferase involved in cell wall biosynthesis
MLILARELAERGHHVDLVVVRPQGPFRDQLSSRVNLVALDPWSARLPILRRYRGLWVVASTPALATYLRRSRPDVVLSTSTPANLALLWARRLAGVDVPVVVTVNVHLSEASGPRQAAWGRWLRLLARRFYRGADAVIAISEGVAEDLAAAGIPRQRLRTIYNPVDVAEIERLACVPADHPWMAEVADIPVVLAVGKLKRQKDFATLLRAFRSVRATRPARLVILGEGEERRRLERLARQLGIEADVVFRGFVENPFAWMARASVLVLSSAWEGLSNVLLEALACGCPVVATDCRSGPREILAGGEYGPLVPVGDDAALARAILTVLDHPPARERLRARAQGFTVAAAVDRYLDVLSSLGCPPALAPAGGVKLALLVRSLSGGGMERIVTTLANGFARRGYETILLTGVAHGDMQRKLSPHVRLVALPASSHLAARLWALRAEPGAAMVWPLVLGPSPRMLRHLPALVSLLQRERIDVLFSAGTQSNLVALWARRMAGANTRVVVSERNTMSSVVAHSRRRFRKAYPGLARQAYQQADSIIAVSDGVAADLCRLTGLPRERVVTIRNPVVSEELRRQSRAPVDHPWLADARVPVILGVGRLHRQKDFPTLIRAFAQLRARRPARLIILGEGELRPALEALVCSLGLDDDVELPGYTDNPYAWIARASAFALSSAYEGTANVLIEALACGCPVVSTDCPNGPREVLEGGRYGALVAVGDAAAMASAIESVLDNPPDREALRARAALYDRDANIDRYLQVLLEKEPWKTDACISLFSSTA